MSAALPDYQHAVERVLAACSPHGRTERVDLNQALGRIIDKTIIADRDLPPFNRAMMDGYALRAGDLKPDSAMPIAANIAAGASPSVDVRGGSCVVIATGAALPPSLDTVIQHELSDRADPVHFSIDAIEPGHAVHLRGSDAREGRVLIEPGTRLTAHHLGIAASVGAAHVSVRAAPRVIVLTSGDEVRPPDERAIAQHQIRNSNGVMLSNLITSMGAVVAAHRHLVDERQETIDAVRAAIDEADLVVTTGGISAGERDFFHAAIDELKLDRVLSGAAIQPGKPVAMGATATSGIMLSLPGNPVSSLACACLFAWPIIERLTGRDGALPWREVPLLEPLRANPRRRQFRPAALDARTYAVRVPSWQGSGDLVHTASTDGLAELPLTADEVPAGTIVRFLPWPLGC